MQIFLYLLIAVYFTRIRICALPEEPQKPATNSHPFP